MTLADHATLADLAGRVEPFLLERMARSGQVRFAVQWQTPPLTANRLDLAIKLAWLDAHTGASSEFASRLYGAHIAAFSLGDMKEPGNSGKSGLAQFEETFARIYASLQARGFDADQSLVPLARDGSILNGAHRVAAAIHLGVPVACVDTGLEPMHYNADYFQQRGMPSDLLDSAAIKYAERAPQSALALLWPAAQGQERAVDALLGGVVHRMQSHLPPKAGHALLSRVYAGEPWLGSAADDYPGITNKLAPCFSGTAPLRAILFDAPATVDRIALKDKVRELYRIGKHSIHITDTHGEAVELARLLFNPNGLHFLEHARPTRFSATSDLADAFAAYLREHAVAPNQAALDTGMVLGAYGLRAPRDVDYVATAAIAPSDTFEWHNGAAHDASPGDLLQDPQLHFDWAGLRYVALRQVATLKAARQAGRDTDDLALIAPLLSQRTANYRLSDLALKARMARARLRRRLIRGLGRLGLKEPVKRVYRKLRSRP